MSRKYPENPDLSRPTSTQAQLAAKRIGDIFCIVVSRGYAYLVANATYDGSMWQRIDTSRAAYRIEVGHDSGFNIDYAASGANPITWTRLRTINNTSQTRSSSWTPGSLGVGVSATLGIAGLSGLNMGDIVEVSASVALTAGLILRGQVTSATSLEINITNAGTATQNPGTFTAYAKVIPR